MNSLHIHRKYPYEKYFLNKKGCNKGVEEKMTETNFAKHSKGSGKSLNYF